MPIIIPPTGYIIYYAALFFFSIITVDMANGSIRLAGMRLFILSSVRIYPVLYAMVLHSRQYINLCYIVCKSVTGSTEIPFIFHSGAGCTVWHSKTGGRL